jgi:hypothetical protein
MENIQNFSHKTQSVSVVFISPIVSLLPRNIILYTIHLSGFGGLEVSVLASGTQVRGFKPGRSRLIFQSGKNPQARLPSEGK